MRMLLAIALVGSLIVGLIASAALANDHSVRNRWTGAAIGAGVVVMGSLIMNTLGAAPPAVAAPSVVSIPPPVVYAPLVVGYRTWVPGHYEKRWVPATERERVWMEGHHEHGWWVPGHWEDRVRGSGYWARVWVEGSWR